MEPFVKELRTLARKHRVALGGGAAASDRAPAVQGLVMLSGDPIAEAERLTTLVDT